MSSQQKLIIDVLSMPLANTQYSYDLPADAQRFNMKIRAADVPCRVSNVTGKVATPTDPYYTIPANTAWDETDLMLPDSGTLYFATASASQVLEIRIWTGVLRSS